jgi:hypothetical protein
MWLILQNKAFFAGVDYKRVDPDSTSRYGADELFGFAQYDDHPGPGKQVKAGAEPSCTRDTFTYWIWYAGGSCPVKGQIQKKLEQGLVGNRLD